MALVLPPADIPADLSEDVEKLYQSVRTLLTHKSIPWQVMAKLAQDGYVTMEDLADGWDTAETARTAAPAELDFARNAHITEAQEKFIAMRIYQCVRHAKSAVEHSPGRYGEAASPGKSTLGGSLDVLCDRKQLLKNWDDVVKLPRPKLEFQGSDTFLKKQWKYCSQGEIGWFQIKHIVSALPEMDERPISTRRKITLNGWGREEEEEERKVPTTREQLKRAHLVYRNTLLMCLSSFPQFTQFNVQFQDLEDWYCFFWGKDIADRKPPRSETVLLYAERNAWREIHNRVSTLKEAMAAQRLTLSSGRERCMRGSKNHKTEHRALRGTHHPQRARAKPSRHGHRHRTNGPRANRPRKVSPGRALQREKTPIGPRTGPQPPRGGCSTAKTISFVTSALETVADHMDAL